MMWRRMIDTHDVNKNNRYTWYGEDRYMMQRKDDRKTWCVEGWNIHDEKKHDRYTCWCGEGC